MNTMVVAEDLSSHESKVIWSCREVLGKENILWLIEAGPDSYIKVFGERLNARYSMSGLSKRWDWGLASDDSYNYTITLGPDLTASYYDFTGSGDGRATARQFYKCSK